MVDEFFTGLFLSTEPFVAPTQWLKFSRQEVSKAPSFLTTIGRQAGILLTTDAPLDRPRLAPTGRGRNSG
jgi:hypothetical protein